MRHFKILAVLALALATAALVASAVWAGHPHVVVSASVACSSDSVTISGKEAGLGDEDQITIVVSATAQCINGGGNHPKAVNKESLSSTVNVPVQNGKAEYSINLTATFSPSCDPPMTVKFTDINVTDTTNSITLLSNGTCTP